MRSNSILLGSLALMISMVASASDFRWDKVPAKDHARTNPLAGNGKAMEGGAAIYKEHCAQCHGPSASGDGKKVPALNTDEVKAATDGDIEWFLRQGDLSRGMPSWSSLPQVQRWQLIAYLRTLPR